VPESGTPWLDGMIRRASVNDAATKIAAGLATTAVCKPTNEDNVRLARVAYDLAVAAVIECNANKVTPKNPDAPTPPAIGTDADGMTLQWASDRLDEIAAGRYRAIYATVATDEDGNRQLRCRLYLDSKISHQEEPTWGAAFESLLKAKAEKNDLATGEGA